MYGTLRGRGVRKKKKKAADDEDEPPTTEKIIANFGKEGGMVQKKLEKDDFVAAVASVRKLQRL